jgi:hypothetical protein
MVHLWHSGKRAEGREETSTALGGGTSGYITVLVEDNDLAQELVHLACLMAKRARCGVRLLHHRAVLWPPAFRREEEAPPPVGTYSHRHVASNDSSEPVYLSPVHAWPAHQKCPERARGRARHVPLLH